MNRSLKLPLLMALALGSGQVLAVDLGQIQVKSALGQPLLAEIPVQQATPAELQQLHVQLASGDGSAAHSAIPLQFGVVDGGNGDKVIRITSQVAVNDPFLDLLVEVHGSSGKSVREFTILLDPPGSENALPLAQLPPLARTTKSSAAPAPQPAAAHVHSADQAANGRFGPVERGQTLSTVARQTAPAGVDVNQMLLALKQANPDAFYRDNINALKAGAVLRIPSQAEAEAMAAAAAVAEVRRQNGDWRNGTVGSAPTTVADAGTRATTTSSPTAAGGMGDHLALVPAKQGGKANGASGGGEGGNALRQDLQRSQETLASLQQQDEDLKSRLKDLTDINGKNQRLLALKDNEIAELQQKLAAASKTAGASAAAASTVAAVAPAAAQVALKSAEKPAGSSTAATLASSTAATSASTQAAATPAKASTTSTSKPAVAPVKAAPPKPAVSPSAPANEQPWYLQLWVVALGGIVLLLVLLGLLRGRGGKAKPVAVAPKPVSSLADHFEPIPLPNSADDAELDALLDQLAEHPDDIGLHLELVSLYYDRRDVEHFEAAAEVMHAHISDPHQEEWQEVVRMGEELAPSHPLFAHHDGASADELEAHHGFDIDQYGDEAAVEPAFAPAPAGPPPMPALLPVKVSEYNYNFNITQAHDKSADSVDSAESDIGHHAVDGDATAHAPASNWQFDEPAVHVQPAGHDIEPRDLDDDPVDTKLDLARAYMDMGDPEGARAMLEEVLHEGSQMQRDVARRLLGDLH